MKIERSDRARGALTSPRLLPLHGPRGQRGEPAMLRASKDKMEDQGIYLLDMYDIGSMKIERTPKEIGPMYTGLIAIDHNIIVIYPRLLPLHRPRGQGGEPAMLRASRDKMEDQGIYLLENGVHMLLWVGSAASPELTQALFGQPSPQAIDTSVRELPVLDNELSEAARELVDQARRQRRVYMRLTVMTQNSPAELQLRRSLVEDATIGPSYVDFLLDVHKAIQNCGSNRHLPNKLTIMRQHDKLEVVLRHFLVEDRGVDGRVSYVDYLCHIHKEIRALL
ncbi:unnamed protein product [Plutella xylostella]|uniref:(diamondback moth) hypothetical protein n=1 Tax=Plutella xylostella TaxID=51655 RepID=A0A8S4FYU1_PLUXY|nr:unnamed protein product [Plutella xylostella]